MIPVYNERGTLLQSLERVRAVRLPEGIQKEILLIDDGSTDGSLGLLKELERDHVVLYQDRNHGKGAALRRAFGAVSGDFVTIHDADLELDPQDLVALLKPVLAGECDICYGNRFAGGNAHRYARVYFGLRMLGLMSRWLNGLPLHDIYCCYKLYRRDVLEAIRPRLVSDRFAIEAELTARAKGYRVKEVPIAYHPRSYSEGKKIRLVDGFRGLWAILYFNLL